MPTDSLEVVVVIMEVDMEVDEEADNGIDKELDMDHKKWSGHKSYLAIKVTRHFLGHVTIEQPVSAILEICFFSIPYLTLLLICSVVTSTYSSSSKVLSREVCMLNVSLPELLLAHRIARRTQRLAFLAQDLCPAWERRSASPVKIVKEVITEK